ncbi:MAG: SsrA-binding protein SmpB [Candidatus Caldarchaeum sp.]
MAKKRVETPLLAENRKARHEYDLLERYEAGIALQGSEVKSVLTGKLSLSGAYCRVVNGEAWVFDLDIAPYEKASTFVPERRRPRKLLLHKREIEQLRRKAEIKGLTIVPTKVYYKNKRVKVEIAIARGRKKSDKREKILEREERRQARQPQP